MNLDSALRLWLASPYKVFDPDSSGYVDGPPRYVVPDGYEIETIDITHEEGWSNDSGTSWPADVTVVVTRIKADSPARYRHRKKDQVDAGSDPVEFMKELFDLVDQHTQ